MSKTILTKEGFENLRQKLADKIQQLKMLRDEKAHAYTASGDGWHDNPGWVQLGQQEEMLAKEVAMLQQKISSAMVVDPEKMDRSKVGLGCVVEFILFKPGTVTRTHRMMLVGSGESDVKNKMIAFDSPLGSALCSMTINQEKAVEIPGGRVQIKVCNISYE